MFLKLIIWHLNSTQGQLLFEWWLLQPWRFDICKTSSEPKPTSAVGHISFKKGRENYYFGIHVGWTVLVIGWKEFCDKVDFTYLSTLPFFLGLSLILPLFSCCKDTKLHALYTRGIAIFFQDYLFCHLLPLLDRLQYRGRQETREERMWPPWDQQPLKDKKCVIKPFKSVKCIPKTELFVSKNSPIKRLNTNFIL